MKVLLTGGAGFIGSHIAEAYQQKGYQVLVVDDLSSGKRENLPPELPLRVASITDTGMMEDIFLDFRPDIVNHHAAQINVRHSVDDPVFDARVNISGTLVLAELAVRHGVKRFVFASSGGAIYGEQDIFPAGEDHSTRPLSPYGVSKLAGESYLYFYEKQWGLPSSVLRYSNVYGPRQDPHGEAGVVAIFITRILEGEQPVINGDGEQTRDYIYVGDVVSANMAVTEKGISGAFNIGTGREVSVNELFGMIREVSGGHIDEVHGPAKKGEQQRSSISPALLAREAGWAPEYTLEDGLGRTFEFFAEKLSRK